MRRSRIVSTMAAAVIAVISIALPLTGMADYSEASALPKIITGNLDPRRALCQPRQGSNFRPAASLGISASMNSARDASYPAGQMRRQTKGKRPRDAHKQDDVSSIGILAYAEIRLSGDPLNALYPTPF